MGAASIFTGGNMETMLRVAFSYLGVPYIWGGHSREGLDCSGFAQLVLASVGLDPKGDQTAQALFQALQTHTSPAQFAEGGDLLFFGTEAKLNQPEHITHVAIAIDSWRMIEAGGGDRSCVTVPQARSRGAEVRVRPISDRSDFLHVIRLKVRGIDQTR